MPRCANFVISRTFAVDDMLEIMKASAGSGKTYNLAGKYIGLLLKSDDRYAYRHILAVTFTNKATDEMKNRILKELFILSTEPDRSGYRDRFIPSLFPSDEDLRRKAERVLQGQPFQEPLVHHLPETATSVNSTSGAPKSLPTPNLTSEETSSTFFSSWKKLSATVKFLMGAAFLPSLTR